MIEFNAKKVAIKRKKPGTGAIKNPPADLAGRIRAIKVPKKGN